VKTIRLFPLIVLVFLSLFLIAARSLQPTDPTDLVAVLTWLAGIGAVYVVGYGLSFLLEKVPGWGMKVPGWAKGAIIIVFSIGVALGAQYLLTQTHVIVLLGPVFTLIVQMILAYLGTQKAFAFQVDRKLLAARPRAAPG
jgi:hypothetical protein